MHLIANIYWKILKIWFTYAIFDLLKVPQRSDKISHWEEWNVVSKYFWSKSYLPHRNFSRILLVGKITIFQPRSLGTRLTIFMEQLLFKTLILLQEFQSYVLFFRSKLDLIFNNDWFQLKQVLQGLCMSFISGFWDKTFKTIFKTTQKKTLKNYLMN